MLDVTLNTKSWNRFLASHLVIMPDVAGSMHQFLYEEHRVRVMLPTKDQLPADPNSLGRDDPISCWAYKEVDGQKIPAHFFVHLVDVTVEISELISIPQEVLSRPPNAYDILPKAKQAQLDQLASTYNFIAEKAFDYWVRVLRWKSRDGSICRPHVTHYQGGWPSRIITDAASQPIWNVYGGRLISVPEEPAIVTSDMWASVNHALQNGDRPPLHIELLFDGIEHMRLGDFRRATVDMAIACETFLRSLFAASLPSGLNTAVKDYLDDANIRPVLTKFVPEILDTLQNQRLKKIEGDLHKLFDARNDIVHKAKPVSVELDDCVRFLEAARKLFAIQES